jgi:periplasmic protein TonB
LIVNFRGPDQWQYGQITGAVTLHVKPEKISKSQTHRYSGAVIVQTHADEGDEVSSDAASPPTLGYATAPAVRPLRGFGIAGGLHLIIVGVVLVLIRLHMPLPPPDGPVISVVVETTPRGNTAAPVTQLHVMPPPPAPRSLPQPPLPMRATGSAPIRQTPPPVLSQKTELPPAMSQGASLPGQKVGSVVVGATHPARPDAGSTVFYSALSRELGEQGEVRLNVQVLPNGRPGRVTVVKGSGYPRLDRDARNSVLTWQFHPAMKSGMPVSSVLSYWVRFVLQ